jgi:cytoskeletal protein RodZ
MVDTVGKKLQQARLQKHISLEEASRVTKMRPDRITDLEHDDYTQFPSLTYAKGFLLIYAKYLGVDVSDFARSFENETPIGSGDYQYLENTPEPIPATVRHTPERSAKPGLAVLIFGVFVTGGILLVLFVMTMWKRIEPDNKAATPAPGPATSAAAQPAPGPTARPEHEGGTVQAVGPDTGVATASATPAPGTRPIAEPPPEAHAPPPVEAGVGPPLPVATPIPVKVKEVIVQPIKKTWVKIQKDEQNSKPIFEDWLYPDAHPLKLRGERFWIQLRDPDAVKIWVDGQLKAATGANVAI